ncbi:MAG: Hsp20/alpha crystallin family protein [Flavobacteriaceae bacterium]|nr:Hsp20/alpha crystallin family protein [Flavobacteriaceae bacterium]
MNLVKRNYRITPSFFDQLIYNELGRQKDSMEKQPATNISESENQFLLEIAVPGKSKSDFKIEINKEILTIGLETENEISENDPLYHKKEFDYSSFQRSFTLPDSVAVDQIDARYTDGVLKLVLPKKKESLPQPKKWIKVK